MKPNGSSANGTVADAQAARLIAELRARLQEAEETLNAIRNGDVDAVVVGGPSGQQVYTLQNADRPYRVLIEQMQEGAVTLTGQGTILYCNERFATIVGFPREVLIGDDVRNLFGDEDAMLFVELLKRGRDRRAAGEFTLLTASRIDVPVNISLVDLQVEEGAPRIVCGVVTDLTLNRRRGRELAEANNALQLEIGERRRAEDSLRLALDAAEMGGWTYDLLAKVSQRSERHDQIFGIADAGSHWGVRDAFAQILKEDRGKVLAAFRDNDGRSPIEFETRIRRVSDGAVRWIAVKGQTFYQMGVPVRVAGVVSDVTERREVEEQLRQAQKMEAVGQLTGGIAHDFNNILMVIGGCLDVLVRSVTLEGNVKRLFDAAQRSVERGAKLNQQLLTFSRRQNLRAETVCVNEMIPEFEHLLERALGAMTTVRVELDPRPWYCRTDPHQLEIAILNLAINARDAMPDGGTVTLRTENRSVGSVLAARWDAVAGDYVMVSVQDTGCGMSPEVLKRVFEPFFTTKEVGKGTGLGLSQVYGFVKQSGGFVAIESEPGRGTVVSLHLPRVEQRSGAARPMPLAEQVGGLGVVLVVDDDRDVRATTGHMLMELGYRVREADSAPHALQLLDDGLAVDLVITDIIMPHSMSGIELAAELHRRRPELPVLLISGYTAQRIIPDAARHELRLLRKPFSLGELSQSVRQALQRPGA